MNRTGVLGFAFGILGAILAPVALAQSPDPARTVVTTKVTSPDRSNDINKEVGLVDLYLTEAINNAKFLMTIADASPGSSDKAILAEARKNLDAAIDRTLGHVERLNGWRSDLALAADRPNARAPTTSAVPSGTNLGALDELERQLKNAKAADKKLAVRQLSDLSGAIDGVATHLMGADNAFRSVARWTSYTRLSSTNLSTVPVRGDELPPGRGATRELQNGGVVPAPGSASSATGQPVK